MNETYDPALQKSLMDLYATYAELLSKPLASLMLPITAQSIAVRVLWERDH